MRIEKEFIKMGYFWLPDNPQKKIPGTLTIKDGGGIELEVLGLFYDDIKLLNEDDDLSRIIGHIEGNHLITLDNCFFINKNISLGGGISKSKICVNRALHGVAYDKDEEITFNSLSFSVDCMDEWVHISGINEETNWENRTTVIHYSPPEKMTYLLNNDMELEICFAYTLPGLPNLTEAKITQKAYFNLKSDKLKPFNDFIFIAHKITNFMCFAIDETVSIKEVLATSSEIQRDIGDGKHYSIPIEIYYKSITYSEKIPKQNSHNMLFSFKTIKSNAEDIFNNWLNAYETISPTLHLYFSTKIDAQKYLEGKFLALIQGLETYHRRTSNQTMMSQAEFDSLVSSITEKCPTNHLEWLQGRLKFGNEINLNKRIKLTIEPFKERLGNNSDRKKLVKQIVDTRNYLTHYNDDLKEDAVSGKDLWILCQKIEVIFQLHFLKVVGFNDEEINSIVENCYPLKEKIAQ